MKYDVYNHDVCDNYDKNNSGFLGWLNMNFIIKKWKLRTILTHTLNLIQS